MIQIHQINLKKKKKKGKKKKWSAILLSIQTSIFYLYAIRVGVGISRGQLTSFYSLSKFCFYLVGQLRSRILRSWNCLPKTGKVILFLRWSRLIDWWSRKEEDSRLTRKYHWHWHIFLELDLLDFFNLSLLWLLCCLLWRSCLRKDLLLF